MKTRRLQQAGGAVATGECGGVGKDTDGGRGLFGKTRGAISEDAGCVEGRKYAGRWKVGVYAALSEGLYLAGRISGGWGCVTRWVYAERLRTVGRA